MRICVSSGLVPPRSLSWSASGWALTLTWAGQRHCSGLSGLVTKFSLCMMATSVLRLWCQGLPGHPPLLWRQAGQTWFCSSQMSLLFSLATAVLTGRLPAVFNAGGCFPCSSSRRSQGTCNLARNCRGGRENHHGGSPKQIDRILRTQNIHSPAYKWSPWSI